MIELGKHSAGASVRIDLPTLLRTRMLIQANSGGGKSWMLRRILEQTYGKVQQIVIDWEGEFVTLREKYDYVLAGKGGEVSLSVRSAPLLARRLLELRVNCILDLYELKYDERLAVANAFISALVEAPKKLWHPCLIPIDEAHHLAPEGAKIECSQAVIDLCTRGRKRGFAAILATQRLSKLDKDAAAELINKLIGRTGLDVDVKRAADDLGFYERETRQTLRSLGEGEFYAFGPAISKEVVKFKSGGINTSHPSAGTKYSDSPPPAPDAIKKLVEQLADLPKQAEEERITLETAKKKIRDLEAALKTAEKAGINPTELKHRVDVEVAIVRQHLDARHTREVALLSARYGRLVENMKNYMDGIALAARKNSELISKGYDETMRDAITYSARSASLPSIGSTYPGVVIKRTFENTTGKPADLGAISGSEMYDQKTLEDRRRQKAEQHRADLKRAGVDVDGRRAALVSSKDLAPPEHFESNDPDRPLNTYEEKIIGFVGTNSERSWSVAQVAWMVGYHTRTGHFLSAIRSLVAREMVTKSDGKLSFKDWRGMKLSDEFSVVYEIANARKVMNTYQVKVFDLLIETPEVDWRTEDIALHIGYHERTGHFLAALRQLRSVGILEKRGSHWTISREFRELL